jgi:ribonucleoside-triphosphate reductase (formate)
MVAKNYILYREQRRLNREVKNITIEVGKTFDEYLEKSDWRVNANANS